MRRSFAARPDVIVHQLTEISVAHAGKPDIRPPGRWFALTSRLRTEGTDHLLAAAGATGVRHVVAQSHASWNGVREGGWVKTEEDPLDLMEGTPAHGGMPALRHLEDAVLRTGGAALRYGACYGPGAVDDQVELIRRRQRPPAGPAEGARQLDPPRRRGGRDRPRGGAASAGRVRHRRELGWAGSRGTPRGGRGSRRSWREHRPRRHLPAPIVHVLAGFVISK
ncbi:hypothetical protein OHB00_32745 [Streptomyces sp. NBC_00631]|uniref:hypothetical protein n=1 Tax=Streptomyces sp. NBC_00631 TaxID=2975793 RepID=UPI0030E0C282